MKSVNYSQFPPDSIISPLWLNELLRGLIILLSLVFVSLMLLLIFLRKAVLFVVILEIVFALVLSVYVFYFIYSNCVKQTKVYINGRICLPRKNINVSDINKIEIYRKAYIVGTIVFVDIFTDSGVYSVSIKEVDVFVSMLRKLNNKFIIVDNRKENV